MRRAWHSVLVVLLVVFCGMWGLSATQPVQCRVYCDGDLLAAIQSADIFKDCKDFVDMPMVVDPEIVLQAFHNLTDKSPETLRKFLSEYFLPPGSELLPWVPTDWTPTPAFIKNISDPKLVKFGLFLNSLWEKLGKQLIPDVHKHPQRYSVLPMQHPFVVPGGRFREFYYWDTYWIVKGLLVSDMKQTAKLIITNMLDMVQKFGFFPNGARIYYLNRSQPPLLSEMIYEYYFCTGDNAFLEAALKPLDMFWMQEEHHAVKLPGGHVLNRFWTDTTVPRPESWRDDTEDAEGMGPPEKIKLWSNIAAAAESGHDFSTRDGAFLNSTVTTTIIPVDLNSILYKFEGNLAEFYKITGRNPPVDYAAAQQRRLQAINRFLWDPVAYQWFDYSLTTNHKRTKNYPSNFHPLWSGAYDQTIDIAKVLESMKNSGLIKDGGVITSLVNSGQQWDSPNAWAPIQSFWIGGLHNLQLSYNARHAQKLEEEPKDLARQLAQSWINSNFLGFVKYAQMMEKYDAFHPGEPGSGGEYKMPIGFGWTNGVALELLKMYPDLNSL